MAEGEKTVASNRKAFHDFHVEERLEAGIVLLGSEVKSLREGRVQLRDSYAIVRSGEAFVMNVHISPYSSASTHVELDPVRPRKLLLRKQEIDKLRARTQEKGMTVVPLRVYFTHGLAKIELGIARGKHTYDKRRDVASREAKREMERATRRAAKRG